MHRPGEASLVNRLEALRRANSHAVGSISPGEAEPARADASVPTIETRLAVLGLSQSRLARVKPERDHSLASEIDAQARLIRCVQRGITQAAVAWEQLLNASGLPMELRSRIKVKSYKRGTLTIRVTDSSTQYALARFLRSGGEARLGRLSPVVVSRVKLVM